MADIIALPSLKNRPFINSMDIETLAGQQAKAVNYLLLSVNWLFAWRKLK
jgi:hypothetical protein